MSIVQSEKLKTVTYGDPKLKPYNSVILIICKMVIVKDVKVRQWGALLSWSTLEFISESIFFSPFEIATICLSFPNWENKDKN